VNGEAWPTACPDAETLSAFAERTLDDQRRKEIERHLADCPECPGVVGATVQFLSDDAENDGIEAGPRRQWRWVTAAATLAAIAVPVVIWHSTSRDPLRRLKQLAAATETRSVEGRLAGFEYVPFSRTRSDTHASADLGIEAEIARLSEQERTDAAGLHARGVALLLAGEAQAALGALASAVRADSRSAIIWNDLAVAYLAEAELGVGSASTRALEAASRAAALAPDLAAAHFNRALALERMKRPAEAMAAYRQAVALEPRSRWTAEAEQHVRSMSR
jgi:tetratricopeptide (TPR) repeat protein